MKFSQAWERVSIERAKLAGRKELEKRAANHAESMKRFKEFLAKVGEQRRIKPKL
ncbi:MAG: hypothetical protein NTY48_04025 [Candidatus Diapherotrites archaeon]|nr:hypothetical protein [Candidatus Diapherotrites archaeon]